MPHGDQSGQLASASQRGSLTARLRAAWARCSSPTTTGCRRDVADQGPAVGAVSTEPRSLRRLVNRKHRAASRRSITSNRPDGLRCWHRHPPAAMRRLRIRGWKNCCGSALLRGPVAEAGELRRMGARRSPAAWRRRTRLRIAHAISSRRTCSSPETEHVADPRLRPREARATARMADRGRQRPDHLSPPSPASPRRDDRGAYFWRRSRRRRKASIHRADLISACLRRGAIAMMVTGKGYVPAGRPARSRSGAGARRHARPPVGRGRQLASSPLLALASLQLHRLEKAPEQRAFQVRRATSCSRSTPQRSTRAAAPALRRRPLAPSRKSKGRRLRRPPRPRRQPSPVGRRHGWWAGASRTPDRTAPVLRTGHEAVPPTLRDVRRPCRRTASGSPTLLTTAPELTLP